MAFKNVPPTNVVPDNPEELLLSLPRRTIKGILLHQGEMMKAYRAQAVDAQDVALQLPTGSGKTLVGLMIGEWRRRKFNERVVYLCPTRQLVNQVVEQADKTYGLTVRGFTGPITGFEPGAKADYQNGNHVAVTTYSALFNTNPFFSNADVIILDDAHAAENYVASMWSLRVGRAEHPAFHTAIANLVRPLISSANYSRLTGAWEGPDDAAWADKLATPTFASIRDEFRALVDAHSTNNDFRYPWMMLRDHLDGCHLYLSSQDILLRPLIPATWTHEPFVAARQRIYMSATLGAGGDLERLTGRRSIMRLPVPSGWDRQGIGRRLFIFPGMSLNDDDTAELRHKLMVRAGRSLVLVPSERARATLVEDLKANPGYPLFSADDIEASKENFTRSPKAVAVVANRYDGIDFPGNDCRLLFVEGLPRATNTQEKFLMTRMGANALYNERIQTRVLQAIGRCTRSLEDYSAVVVSGEDVPEYLGDRRRRRYFHPELQAELEFGIEQSQAIAVADFVENLDTFLKYGKPWEAANDQILQKRAQATQQQFPAMDELQAAVGQEVRFQEALWHADYDAALSAAERTLTTLVAPELKGYRALWHYLAGSAAWLGGQTGLGSLTMKAREHFASAKKVANGIPWLVELSRYQPTQSEASEDKSTLFEQLEHVESLIHRLGTLHDGKFDAHEKRILDGLASTKKGEFEAAHVLLGRTLGYIADNQETDAAPDPWWISGKICLVFEDHAGADATSTLSATKARQAATHPDWIRANVQIEKETEIAAVLVTPVSKAEDGARPHLGKVLCWPLSQFREWAKDALSTVRELRRSFIEPGDLVWRAQAAQAFEAKALDAENLLRRLKCNPASEYLK